MFYVFTGEKIVTHPKHPEQWEPLVTIQTVAVPTAKSPERHTEDWLATNRWTPEDVHGPFETVEEAERYCEVHGWTFSPSEWMGDIYRDDREVMEIYTTELGAADHWPAARWFEPEGHHDPEITAQSTDENIAEAAEYWEGGPHDAPCGPLFGFYVYGVAEYLTELRDKLRETAA